MERYRTVLGKLIFMYSLWIGIAQYWAATHKHLGESYRTILGWYSYTVHLGERYRAVLGWYLYTPCEEVSHSPGVVFPNTLERFIAQSWAGIHKDLVERLSLMNCIR